MIEDVKLGENTFQWLRYHYNPMRGCNEYVADSSWDGRGTGYSMAKHSGGGEDPNWNDPTWRHENLSLEGIAARYAKHAEGTQLSHPMAWVLGFQSPINGVAYASNRSETWGIPQGMANVASPNLMATIDLLYAAHSDELWDMLVPIKELPVNTPRTFFWMTQIYEPTMAIPTTARGMPVVVDALQRTGVGRLDTFKIEGELFIDFWKTQMGTEHFNAVLSVMARGMVTASQYGAAVKLADADYEYMEIMKRENRFLPTLEFMEERKAMFWAFLQRPNHTSFAKLRSEMDNILFAQHSKRGKYMFVMTKLTWDVITKTNEHALKHDIMSERGLDILQSHAAELMDILGDQVAVVPPFYLQKNLISQPFETPAEIAEYVMMSDTTGGLNTKTRDRMIFTQEEGFKEVTFETALENLYIWDKDGNPIPFPKKDPRWADAEGKYDASTNTSKNFLLTSYYPWCGANHDKFMLWSPEDAAAAADDLAACAAMRQNGCAASVISDTCETLYTAAIQSSAKSLKSVLVTAHKANKVLPFDIMVLQPHQRYMTQNCLYMLPGNVAVRVKKPGEAMVQDVNRDFIHRVTVQGKLGAANEMPQNLAKAGNVVVSQYLGGCGIQPINLHDGNYSPKDYKYNGDLIFIPVPRGWVPPKTLNLHGTMSVLQQVYGHPEDVRQGWYPGCALLNSLTHWVDIQTGIPTKRLWPRETFRVVRDPIPCAARCATYLQRDDRGTYTWVHAGQGYWGFDGTYQEATKHRIKCVFERTPARSAQYVMV